MPDAINTFASGPWLVLTPAASVHDAGETWVATSTPVDLGAHR